MSVTTEILSHTQILQLVRTSRRVRSFVESTTILRIEARCRLCAAWQSPRDHCDATVAKPALHSTWTWGKKHKTGVISHTFPTPSETDQSSSVTLARPTCIAVGNRDGPRYTPGHSRTACRVLYTRKCSTASLDRSLGLFSQTKCEKLLTWIAMMI